MYIDLTVMIISFHWYYKQDGYNYYLNSLYILFWNILQFMYLP